MFPWIRSIGTHLVLGRIGVIAIHVWLRILKTIDFVGLEGLLKVGQTSDSEQFEHVFELVY